MEFLIFSVFAVVSVGAALLMVLQRNAMYSALFLVLIFFCLAVFYILLGAYFLAVVQVVVYAGAIMVLVLFVLMLLNLKSESGRKLGIVKPLVALGVGLSVVATVFPAVVAQFKDLSLMTLQENMWRSEGGVKAIGQEIYGRYLVQFELSSLVLLIGIVGAIMLSKRKRTVIGPREGGLGGKQ